MSKWCQNKRCVQKKNQNQIRGSKGAKYYQSNKAHEYYYDMFCSQGCFHSYFNEHKETIRNAVGIIDKQVLPLEDAWYVEYNYRWGSTDGDNARYHLVNKLRGINQAITKQQALQPNTDSEWDTIEYPESKELAIQLGLAS